MLAALVASSAIGDVCIRRDDEWIVIDYRKDIEPDSALDFSGMGFQDAPAGKYGWLKAAKGHAEFETRPGVPARFWGVNVCTTANYLEPDEIERFTDRLVRLGYNALRIHHHDDLWWRNPFGERDKLDRLVAACVRKGIYLTTDLYVSRKVKYRDLGVDRDGEAPYGMTKVLMQIHEPAFENWKAYAREFMTRVNPYTGRSLANEPAMPFVVLINESSAHSSGSWSLLRNEPLCRSEWKRWLTDIRARHPGAYPGVDSDKMPEKGSWWDPSEENIAKAAFSSAMAERFAARATEWLRNDLGVKALLTTENNGPILYPIMAMRSRAGTYADFHWYIDDPQSGARGSGVRMTLDNENPFLAFRDPFDKRPYQRIWGMPLCVSENNYCGPNEYRSMGGLVRGSLAAVQDWTGVWTFAYGHQKEKILEDNYATPGRFDLGLDPIMQATDRLAMLLFLRGDQTTARTAFANVFDAEAVDPVNVHPLSVVPGWGRKGLVWRARLGVSFGEGLCQGVVPIKAWPHSTVDPESPLDTGVFPDYKAGEFTVENARTVGGFRYAGHEINTKVFCAKVKRSSHAMVAVSSLDGAALGHSCRMLLVHLTDAVGDGIVFADERRKAILKWGSKDIIVRDGEADVEIAVEKSKRYAVYALDTTGRRIDVIPSEVRNGWISFKARTLQRGGACLYYEIVAR